MCFATRKNTTSVTLHSFASHRAKWVYNNTYLQTYPNPNPNPNMTCNPNGDALGMHPDHYDMHIPSQPRIFATYGTPTQFVYIPGFPN